MVREIFSRLSDNDTSYISQENLIFNIPVEKMLYIDWWSETLENRVSQSMGCTDLQQDIWY